MKNKIKEYIFRKWDEYPNVHPRLTILPPIFYDVLIFSFIVGLLIKALKPLILKLCTI